MIPETLKTVIEELKHITNIYALFGFLFLLICMYLIAHHHIEPSRLTKFFTSFFKKGVSVRVKRAIELLLFVGVIITVGLWLKSVYGIARYERQKDMPTRHIAKGCPVEMLNDRVKVQLLYITTLKDQEYNKTLGNDEERERIYETVFEKADIKDYRRAARDAVSMDESQWNEFLEGLSRRSCLIIEHTPFARFMIYVGGEVDSNFENRYFFRGQDVSVRTEGEGLPIVKFRLKHVYDAYDRYSGEQEAVIIEEIR